MSNSIREHLIGYLIGAAEPEECSLVEQQLAQDESARRELELLRSSLHPLDSDSAHEEPPAGLAQRCCDYVYSRTEVLPAALSAAASGTSTKATRRWSRLELAVAGAIAAAVAVFLLPKIYQSQIQAQLLACQNNLKDIGFAAADYSQHNGGYYPAVQPGDRINAVGMWAPTLVTQQYIPPSGKTMICPSSTDAGISNFHVPTVEEVEALDAARLAQELPQLSGSYGGPVGYMQDGKYKLPRNQGRSNMAVFADRPGKNGTNSPNHGSGQNVLRDDGSVIYLTTPEIGPNADNIYLNRNHEVAPGVDEGDSVIGDSALKLPPLP
ncbi:MAG TPA: hypothetical protein VMJ32_05045 [Pirellulales bacterium]|nr:hypothetical protein [Pirellulales bacterium]